MEIDQLSGSRPKENNDSGSKGSPLLRWLLLIGVVLAIVSFRFDDACWAWIREHQQSGLLRLAGILSKYGDWPELMLMGLLGVAVAWWARRRKAVKVLLCMLIASTIAGGVVNTVRLTTGRSRPNAVQIPQGWFGLRRNGEWLLFKNKYHAFPSGHSASAFAFFGVLAFAYRRIGWCFLGPAAAIGWSRIYLGAHHLSDVLVGMIVGMVFAYYVWIRVGPWLEQRLL
jgi:membrane-associated phospholipid phosphatase